MISLAISRQSELTSKAYPIPLTRFFSRFTSALFAFSPHWSTEPSDSHNTRNFKFLKIYDKDMILLCPWKQ